MFLAISACVTARGAHRHTIDPFRTVRSSRQLSAPYRNSRQPPFGTFEFQILDLFRVSSFDIRISNLGDVNHNIVPAYFCAATYSRSTKFHSEWVTNAFSSKCEALE